MRELTVFSRPGCHLCEEAIEQIEPMCRAARVGLRVLDVDTSPQWQDQYGLRVPVICGEGKELSGWPLDLGRISGWLSDSP